MNPRQLLHLRSLGALRSLNLTVSFEPVQSESRDHIAASPDDADLPLVFDSLRELRLKFNLCREDTEKTPITPVVDLSRLFGSMPQLRTATIDCGAIISPATITVALAHSTRLTALLLKHDDLTAVHLAAIVRPLTRLRLLCVGSAAIDSLAFLSAPHLADTMQDLSIYSIPTGYPARPPPASELHHLRGLAHLRGLTATLRIRRGDSDDRAARDEYESRRCDLWPHMRHDGVTFVEESTDDE